MDDLERFLLVAEVKSISRASKLLGISQPALSRTIGLLESRFDARLFRRSASGVELTPAGAILFERAGAAVRSLRDANEEITAIAGSENLSLTICAGDSWGFAILPPIIQAFTRLHPNVTIRLDVLDHHSRMSGLRDGSYELAFGIISPLDRASPFYVWTPMIHATYDIYCREGHPILRRRPVGSAELLGQGWINHQLEYDLHPTQLRATGRHYPVRTNTLLNAIELLRGTDYLMSTGKALRPMLERNGIVSLMDDEHSPVFVSGATHLTGPKLRLPARKFLRMVTDAWRIGSVASTSDGRAPIS